MSGLRRSCVRLANLFRRGRLEQDLADEMAANLDLHIADNLRAGMPPTEARRQALLRLGGLEQAKEEYRDARGVPWIEETGRNLRYAVRQLRRSPGFTLTAVLSLALGIGANTAVFTLLDQLVLRLLPVAEPERLVMIWSTGPHLGNNQGNRMASYPMYRDFQREATAFESVFCRHATHLAVSIDGTNERVQAELVSGNFFQALRVGPAVGRVFSPEQDDRIHRGHPSVVLSHAYWVSRFNADPGVVGRKILVNSYPMEIVGVSAPGFVGLDPSQSPQVRVPIQMKPLMTPGRDDLGNRRSQWVHMFARLKPGQTVESARASLQPLFRRLLRDEAEQPDLRNVQPYDRARFLKRVALVETAATGFSELRQRYSTALVVLMAMAGLILLIACSNVANLFIARTMARRKEVAVRLAIGAGRRRLIAQLLVESVLLSLTGAALGLLLSVAAARALLSLLPGEQTTLMLKAEPDLRILLFGTAVALATGVLFGLAPALQGTRLDLWTALKDVAGAVTGSSGGARLRKALVVTQVALSFLLLAGAGLFARTLFNLQEAGTGFARIEGLATFQVDPARSGYTVPRLRRFHEEALRAIRAVPGIQTAGNSRNPVLQGWGSDMTMSVEGHQARDDEDMQAYTNAVSPGYWETMGIKLLQGRDFDGRDRFGLDERPRFPNVAIVNRAFAEHFFDRSSAVGRHLGFGDRPGTPLNVRIIGVVENSLYEGPRAGIRRQVFFSQLQMLQPGPVTYYARTQSDPAALLPALRGAIARLDPALPVYEVRTLRRQLDETLSTERMVAGLSVAFGALATLLAALGLYGVLAFVVARRTKEIGLRMALGARQGAVWWLVLREVLLLVSAGLALGVPVACGLSRLVSSQLFGVTPTDGVSMVAAVALLAAVALAAGLLPARRASMIDPLIALRHE